MSRAISPAACAPRSMRPERPEGPGRPGRPAGPAKRTGRLFAGVVALLAVTLAGCIAVPGSVDGPIAVQLHIASGPTSVEVDASGWFAETTSIYLCPSAPPILPEDAADRVGWSPGPPCQHFGTHPSRDGLRVSLPLDEIGADVRSAFMASDEWYLVLLDLEGDRVSSAVRSAFDAPSGFGVP